MNAIIVAPKGTPLRMLERTRRWCGAETTSVESPSDIHSIQGDGCWLISAGAWSARALPEIRVPAAAQPVVLLGAMLRAGQQPVEAWQRTIRTHGGDFSARDEVLALPVHSIWLNAAAAIAARDSHRLEDVVAFALRQRWRVLRHASLDVFHEDRVRALSVVTSLQRGGAERLVLDLHEALRHDPLVCTSLCVAGSPTRAAFETPPEAIDLASMSSEPEARMEAIDQIARHTGADVLHLHLLDGPVVDGLAAKGWPVLLTLHNARAGWQPGYDQLEGHGRTLLAACARSVAAEALDALPHLPVRTAWNGIKPVRASGRAEFRARHRFAEDTLVLVNVANPRPQKRLHLLPAIVAALHAQGQRAALVLAGEPSHGNEIAEAEITRFEAEARACGMEQWVHHIGPLHDAALANLLAGADVFVSTSEFEGLSLAQLEALSAGLPVVASDVAGAREVPGIRLVPVDASSEDYASAILAEAGFTRTSTTRLPADFTVAASTWRYRWLLRAGSGIALRAGRKRSGLVLITNNFAVGGAQSSAARLLHQLHQSGHHVRAVVLQERESDPTPGLLRVRASGVPVAILPTPDVVEPDVALHGWLDEMASHPPHAVLFWNAIPEYKLLIADALPDVPVWEVSPGEMLHDSLQRWFAKPRPGLPLRTTLDYGAMLAGVIVKQHAEIEQARAAFGKQVHCIANGVPVPAQCPPSRARGNTIIFGTAARLNPHKRIEDLLDAFRMLVTGDIKAELHIAGDVDGELEDYAANLRASAHDLPVRWLGNVERIDAFHREIDIFVMISEPAGCPNAIIEAMASGLPVIATAIGGAVDLIEDGRSGVLVPPREAVCLAHAMIALASDAALCIRLGHAAWDRARACFSVERMAADYARVCLAEETTPRSKGRAEPSAPEIVPSA